MKTGIINGFVESRFHLQSFNQLEKITPTTFESLIHFTSCRTYMADALYSIKTGKLNVTYPFKSKTYDHTKGFTYIGITFLDEHMRDTFIKNMNFIHGKETKAKVRKTTLMETSHPLVIIVSGSKYWKDSCWKIQLYTMYLRMMCYVACNYDSYTYMVNTITKNGNEDTLLSKLKIKKEVFTSMKAGVHVSTGPYAICQGLNPDMAKLLGVNVE
jgi:hypothetical protein